MLGRKDLGVQTPPGSHVAHLLTREAPRHRGMELGGGRGRHRPHPQSIWVSRCLQPEVLGVSEVPALLIA